MQRTFRAPFWLLVVFVLSISSGCGNGAATQPLVDFDERGRLALPLGEQIVWVELAATEAETRRGLMHREHLDADSGMFFFFESPRRLSFWMRNTSIPLDIGYFDRNGILREIYPLYPFDETSVASRSSFLQFALEVNQGWFAQHGIEPGARVDVALLARALTARGIDPARFGLDQTAVAK